MNLGNIITRAALYWPENLAVIDKDTRLTFTQLEDRTNRLAYSLLDQWFAPGSRIAVQGWNCSELVESEVAFYKAGLTKVPVNARLSLEETVHVLNDSKAHAIIAGRDHAEALMTVRDELPDLKMVIAIGSSKCDAEYEALIEGGKNESPGLDPSDDTVAVLHYTSGSSGVLKAAMQTYGNRKALVRKMLVAPSARLDPGARMAHVAPITHASGMMMMPVFSIGGCNVLLGRFDPEELLQTIQDEKITRLFMVPTMVNRMINHPDVAKYDLSSLTSLLYGAAPMTPVVVEKAMDVFGPILTQGYGAGETNSMVTCLTEQDHIDALKGDKKRLASCGRSYFENDVQVLNDAGEQVKPGEVGEIVIKGPDIMAGYWQAPELTEEVMKDGAYYTGDLAVVDHEGYIFIVDRKKEMIISGGFNVYPSEVEKILYRHPDIYEAAVVGVPDEDWGEAIKAVCVLKDGASISEEALVAYCREHLPGFKTPRSIDFTDALPKNPNGKIVRREVRKNYWADQERKVG